MAFRNKLFGTTSRPNLLNDGSFESQYMAYQKTWVPPSITNWFGKYVDTPTVGFFDKIGGWTSNSKIELWHSGFNGQSSKSGNYFIELDSTAGQQNAISQSLQTTAGKDYVISFNHAMRAGTSAATNAFQVLVNGNVIKTVTPGSTTWEQNSLLFKGTGGLDKIEFREMAGDKDGDGGLLDDISITDYVQVSGSGRSSEADGKIRITSSDNSFLLSQVNDPNKIRDVSGFGNNVENPFWANADQSFVRLAPPSYGANFAARGVVNGVQTLANERTISNVISNQDENKDGLEELQNNSFGTNVFLTTFGQFFDHGLDFIKRGTERYSLTTETGSTIAITRGERDASGNHINKTSPFIDQNQTYGSDESVTFYLRKSIGIDTAGNGNITGKSAILLSGANDSSGRETLPTYRDILLNNGVSKAVIDQAIATNNFALLAADADFVDFRNVKDPVTGLPSGHPLLLDLAANANPAFANIPGITFELKLLLDHYVGGDGRLNENIALTPIHTIWHREHDFQVEKLRTMNPTWTENQLFEAAKIIVEGEYQRVVFDEFADAMSGGIPGRGGHGFGGYDSDINASISEEFANAIYRVGHSMVNETVPITKEDGSIVEMSLIDAFLNPRAVASIGVDALIDGQTKVLHQRIDENLVNAVRNQLLGERTNDLGAINIARGRETGLPSLNELRKFIYENGLAIGDQASDLGMTAKGNSSLKPYANWAEFAANLRDPSLVELFKQVYGSNDADVNKVDIWIGGLAEKPSAGQMGSTFGFIFREQLDRLQDGDRFYYKERLDDTDLLADMEAQSFSDIIMRNTGLTNLHDDVFKVAQLKQMATTALTFTGTADHEIIVGNGLFNTINGGAGDDTVYAGAGNDTLYGGEGNDGLRGEAGDDWLWGQNGDDRLLGGEGNDQLNGEAGNDQLFGGNGNDWIYGGVGNDEVNADAGDDTVYGGIGDDILVGGAGVDTLYGEDGIDDMEGGEGNDRLFGGAGDDTLDGNAGNDWIDGGLGLDTASFDTAASGVTVNLVTQIANGLASGSDTLVSIENVEGSAFADSITGNSGNNVIMGRAGNDVISADAGNDVITGGLGVDLLTGGAGADNFVFALTAESTFTAFDRITDFVRGADKLDLSELDANTLVAGEQTFHFTFGNSLYGEAGQLRYKWFDYVDNAQDYTLVIGDTNGDKVGDFAVRVDGIHFLTEVDFIL